RLEDLLLQPQQGGKVDNLPAVLERHHPIERPVRVEAVEDGVEAYVLLARQVAVDARLLEDDADLAADRGGLADRVGAPDHDLARGRRQGWRQDGEGRR